MALNTAPLNSAPLNSAGQKEFLTQASGSAGLGFLALTAFISVTQPASAQANIDVEATATAKIYTTISEPARIGITAQGDGTRVVLPVESASVDFVSWGTSTRTLFPSAEGEFGFLSQANQSVIHPAFGDAEVAVTAYSLAISILHNGVGSALTDISAIGTADVTRYFYGDAEVNTSADALQGKITRFFKAEDMFGVESFGSISVETFAEGEAEIAFESTGQFTRQQFMIGRPATIGVQSSAVVPSIVQYFEAQSSIHLSSSAFISVETFAAPSPAIVKVNSTGWVLDEVFISRIDFASSGLGSYNHRSWAEGLFSVVASPTEGDVTRFVSGSSVIDMNFVAEPAINGIHTASATGVFGLKASTDSLRVLKNVSIFGTVDLITSAESTHIHNSRGVAEFGVLPEAALMSVQTFGDGTAQVNIISEGNSFRTRLFSGGALVFVSGHEFSRRRAGFRGQSHVNFSIEAAPIRIQYFRGAANIDFLATGQSTRTVFPNEEALINFITQRARVFSNLSLPALPIRRFTVDEREFDFEVPFEDRRFEV